MALRKLQCLAVVLLALFLLSSCSGLLIEELLVAPSLDEEQSAIKTVLDGLSAEKVTLKYPLSGQRRGAINLLDLDGDGVEEAVVFYNVASEGINVNIALLKKDEANKWSLVDSQLGEGTDVESFETIHAQNMPVQLLIEWSSVNTSEHALSVYHLEGETLEPGVKKNCIDIVVTDLDNNGSSEIWYVTEGSSTSPFQLSYLYELSGRFAEGPTIDLNEAMLASAGMTAGKLADGTSALFIDQVVDNEQYTTEVFTLQNRAIIAANYADEYSVPELALRNLSLTSRALRGDGVVYIPSDSYSADSVAAPESWLYWYTIDSGEVRFAFATCVEARYNYAVTVPDEWLTYVGVSTSEEEPRRLLFYDVNTQQSILEIRVLAVGEESDPLLEDGYTYLNRLSTYKYYYKSFVDNPDELEYIVENFILFNTM